MVGVDRESPPKLAPALAGRLEALVEKMLPGVDAVIGGDYSKGVVTQELLELPKTRCRRCGVWLSLDPKPVRELDLSGICSIPPNRKEAFELTGTKDGKISGKPLDDRPLLDVAARQLDRFRPALLLIPIGEHGMLLCRRGQPPRHIPTVAREVFDVSGAGDTVIASFTLAVAAGASPIEAAMVSNRAAGVVVGKISTAVVTLAELLRTFPG